MKKYENLELQIIAFEMQDVIATSGFTEPSQEKVYDDIFAD